MNRREVGLDIIRVEFALYGVCTTQAVRARFERRISRAAYEASARIGLAQHKRLHRLNSTELQCAGSCPHAKAERGAPRA